MFKNIEGIAGEKNKHALLLAKLLRTPKPFSTGKD